MSFSSPPPPDDSDSNEEEKGVMHIGGARGRQFWEFARWMLVLFALAAVMVLLFVRFGAPVLWAFALVGFMVAYMLVMGRWAGDDRRQ